MGESKRRKQLDPDYGKIKSLSREAIKNAEKRLILQAKFAEAWGDYLDPVEFGIIESWEPMEVELACIETGVFDNICSPFNLALEIEDLNEHISRGKFSQSPFNTARKTIYNSILFNRTRVEACRDFSAFTKKYIISTFRDLKLLYGEEAVHHKEIWKYIPSDAQDFLDLMKL
jgi:hypothetical protein